MSRPSIHWHNCLERQRPSTPDVGAYSVLRPSTSAAVKGITTTNNNNGLLLPPTLQEIIELGHVSATVETIVKVFAHKKKMLAAAGMVSCGVICPTLRLNTIKRVPECHDGR